jgi:hypothetical protein
VQKRKRETKRGREKGGWDRERERQILRYFKKNKPISKLVERQKMVRLTESKGKRIKQKFVSLRKLIILINPSP